MKQKIIQIQYSEAHVARKIIHLIFTENESSIRILDSVFFGVNEKLAESTAEAIK